MTEAEFKNSLRQFSGSENLYRHTLGILFTDGIRWCCETSQVFWMLDVVGSLQYKLKNEEFQVWTLKVKDSKGEVTCDDGNGNILVKQIIHFTDYRYTELKIWCVNGTVMLPSEY